MKIKSPKYFRIESGDVGSEAYQDCYVHDLQAEVERLRERNKNLRTLLLEWCVDAEQYACGDQDLLEATRIELKEEVLECRG